jgi:two-component system, response regulator
MTPPHEIDILLVEDNPNDAELALRSLRRSNLGRKLLWVKDGVAALETVFGGEPHPQRPVQVLPRVVFLDLKLPKLDGVEVLRQLKSHPRTKSIPVVMLTSSREGVDVARSYHYGVNSYIVKPVEFDRFSEAVAQVGSYWLHLNEPTHPTG